MKQKKLLKELYLACFTHDVEREKELLKKEFRKIAKHRAEGKPFTTRWTLIRT